MANSPICSVAKCGKPANASRGLCRGHYMRWYRYGSVTFDPRKRPARDYYVKRVVPFTGEACLIWPFTRDQHGYAQIRDDGKMKKVHRLVCIEVRGEPPTPKHEAAHSCGNGHLGCVNPNHLSWKTRSENQLDRAIHGTSNRGTRSRTNRLSEDDVRYIREQKGILSQKKLGDRFGVSGNAIHEIHTGKSWSWLD